MIVDGNMLTQLRHESMPPHQIIMVKALACGEESRLAERYGHHYLPQ